MATILIIEDEESLRALYKAEFEEDGHNVLTAAEGATGLEWIRDGSIDLVILDLCLPDMPGVDVLRIALEEIPDMPIIISSAYPIYHFDFSTWSSAAYIIKSGDTRPLKNTVTRILSEKGAARPTLNEKSAKARTALNAKSTKAPNGRSEGIADRLDTVSRL